MVEKEKFNNAADGFFENTMKDWLPRPQPIDFVLHFFNNLKNGVFVDIGAYDGVACSNTFVLEKELGWKGICVEPNPEMHLECIKNRLCPTVNSVISNSTKQINFRRVSGAGASLSCVLEAANEDHLNRIDFEIENQGGTYEDIPLQTTTLNFIFTELINSSIFKNISAPRFIHYLSIDAEGSEYEILKSADFNIFNIPLISIEFDHKNPRESDILAMDFLKENNYNPIEQVCGDLFFSKKLYAK